MRKAPPASPPSREPGNPASTVAAPTGELCAAAAIEAMSGDPNFMTSLARGLAVVRGFTQQKRSLTISQLSQRTGIPRAAVRRCLYTLAKLGYVGADDGKAFSLQPKILGLSHAYLSSTTLASAAQPLLDRVSDVLHESSSLALLEGDEILYIARSSTMRRIMSVDLSIGARLPAYCTSMGRVLLAHLPPAELTGYFARVKLIAYTNRTIIAPAKIRAELERVAAADHAVVDQELELGLRSIAVPVRDLSGRVVAAMNIGTQASRVPIPELEQRFLPELHEAARELGMTLLA
ncbi:MAG: IclR family transcriptional regulator C-terminal domain-containing protein [Betaproteobacteria bacterium]